MTVITERTSPSTTTTNRTLADNLADLLLEDGGTLLQETGFKVTLESLLDGTTARTAITPTVTTNR